MCTKGLLEQKGQSRSTYYIAGERFINSRANGDNSRGDGEMCRADGIENSRGDGENGNAAGETCRANEEMCRGDGENSRGEGIENSRANGENSRGNSIENSRADGENNRAIPEELLEKCKNLKKWESSKKMKDIVLELCTSMPLSLNEIAKTINRRPNSVRYLYVNPLIESGELFYTIPEMLNHPNQKYTAVKNK